MATLRGWFCSYKRNCANRHYYAIHQNVKNSLFWPPINEFLISKRLWSMFFTSCFVLGGLEAHWATFRVWFCWYKRNCPNRDYSAIQYYVKISIFWLPMDGFLRSKRLRSMIFTYCIVLGGLEAHRATFRGWFWS